MDCPSRTLVRIAARMHRQTPTALSHRDPRAEPGSLGPARRRAASVPDMRVGMMTREYPPEVYGGAGVHVTELVAQLRRLCQVEVHCMGAPRPDVFVHQPDARLLDANPALATLSAD